MLKKSYYNPIQTNHKVEDLNAPIPDTILEILNEKLFEEDNQDKVNILLIASNNLLGDTEHHSPYYHTVKTVERFPDSLNFANFDGLTPLQQAVQKNHLEAIQALVDCGANLYPENHTDSALVMAQKIADSANKTKHVSTKQSQEIYNYLKVVYETHELEKNMTTTPTKKIKTKI